MTSQVATTTFKGVDRRYFGLLAVSGAILILFALLFTLLYPLSGLYTEIIPNAIKTKPAWGLIALGVITLDKPLYVVAVILLHVVYLGALVYSIRRGSSVQTENADDARLARIILLVGIACAVILLWSYPLFSQDVYDYLFHTHEWTRYGASPFTHVPSQFSFDPLFIHVSWTDAPSPYGPLWLLITAPLSLLAGDSLFLNLVLFKALTVACYAGSAYLLYLMLSKFLPGYRVAGTLLFAWNPLVLMEFGGSGHNDIVMIFFAMLALWLLVNTRFALAMVALTLSLLVKILTVFVFPLFLVYIWKKLSERTGNPAAEAQASSIRQPILSFSFSSTGVMPRNGSTVLRILILYMLLCVGVAVLAYAPLWEGTGSMAFLRRGDIVGGAPVGNVVTDLMATLVGHDFASTLWKLIAWGGLGLLILRQMWAVWRGSNHVGSQLPGFKQLNTVVAWFVNGPKQPEGLSVNSLPLSEDAGYRGEVRLRGLTVSPRRRTLLGSSPRLKSQGGSSRTVSNLDVPNGASIVSVSADETDLERLARTCMSILFFYAVVVSQYYQPWYLSWALMWAGFLLRPRYAVTLWTLLIFGIVAVTGYLYL